MTPPPVYNPPKPVTLRDLGRIIGAYSIIPLLILMAVNAAIAIWGIGLVYPHMDMHVYLYVVTPWLVNFIELGDWWFFLYYVLLAAVIVISLIWMIRKSLVPLSNEVRGRSPEKGHSPLFTIGTLFMAILAFNVAFYAIVTALGVSTTTPEFVDSDLWRSLYGLAHASVWEEVVTRILLIGVPLLVIDLLRRSKRPERQMKKVSSYILGGGFAIGRTEALLLVFSSTMFGIAHVWSWDLWKIVPALVAGLAFGYLFLKLGVYASILLHFAFDFLSIPMQVWPDSIGAVMVLGLLSLLWMAVGAPFLLYYIAKAVGWVTGRRIWPDAPWKTPAPANVLPPGYYPQHYQYPPAGHQQPGYQQPQYRPGNRPAPAPPAPPRSPTAFGYQCPYCGHGEAVYEDGRLICTKCRRG